MRMHRCTVGRFIADKRHFRIVVRAATGTRLLHRRVKEQSHPGDVAELTAEVAAGESDTTGGVR
jgi:hypothetical protein